MLIIKVPCELNIYLGHKILRFWRVQDTTSFPGFSPTRPTERERDRDPWERGCTRHSGARKTTYFPEYLVSSPASEVILYHALV